MKEVSSKHLDFNCEVSYVSQIVNLLPHKLLLKMDIHKIWRDGSANKSTCC